MNDAGEWLMTFAQRTFACVLMRLRQGFVSLLLGCSVLITACDKPNPTPPPTPVVANATDPQWVSQAATPHAKVAVVFVHGIFGDTLGTWRNDNGETFFRLLQRQPGVGTQIDIFAFGFTSNMFKGGSFSVQEAANKLHESLRYKGVLDYPAVVFVAHSMGGLVVLRDLLTRRETLDKVPLIMLYATPQEGAQIAAIARQVAGNPALEDMVPADRNSFLQQLNDEWKSLAKRPPVICAYEKLPTGGVVIVPWSSATRFCDGAASAIDADHISIVKPDRLEHPSIVVLVNALNRYVVGKDLTAKLEMPDFTLEGDHFVFVLTDALRNTARLVNAGGSKLRFTLAQVSDPHLLLSPDDTPRDIPAMQTQILRAALGFGATAVEYRFVVQSDASPDRVVVVRVKDIADLAKQQARLAQSVAADINRNLQDSVISKLFTKVPKPAAEDKLVGAVRNAVARENPALPESIQWLMAASFLNASNLPTLAATALRRAETASPAAVNSSSARGLAAAIAAQSGVANVFLTAETPKVNLDDVPKSKLLGQLVENGQSDQFSDLAARLQTIPTLKAYGFSLEGDISAAKGNRQAAQTAYKAAATFGPSPSLARRMNDLKMRESAPEPPIERNTKPGALPSQPGTSKLPFDSDDLRRAKPNMDTMRR